MIVALNKSVLMYEYVFFVVLSIWALLDEVLFFLAQSIRIIKFCAYISWKTGVDAGYDWKANTLSDGWLMNEKVRDPKIY